MHALANAQDPTDNISRLPPLIIEEAYQMFSIRLLSKSLKETDFLYRKGK